MHKGTVLIEILKSSHHSDEIDYCIKCAEVDALTPCARQELIDTLTNLSIKLAASPDHQQGQRTRTRCERKP